jgi:hypothetical protein
MSSSAARRARRLHDKHVGSADLPSTMEVVTVSKVYVDLLSQIFRQISERGGVEGVLCADFAQALSLLLEHSAQVNMHRMDFVEVDRGELH